MVAAEAGLVVDAVVGGELVDEVHRLVAGGALGCRPLEGGRHCPLPFFPLQTTHSLPTEARLRVMPALPGCCWWLAGCLAIWELGTAWASGWWLAGCSQALTPRWAGHWTQPVSAPSVPKISAHLVFREVNKF